MTNEARSVPDLCPTCEGVGMVRASRQTVVPDAEGNPSLREVDDYDGCSGCGGTGTVPAAPALPEPPSDDETPCPIREDGAHCDHWYDELGPCCGCGYGARTGAFARLLAAVGEYETFWTHGSTKSKDTLRADMFSAARELRQTAPALPEEGDDPVCQTHGTAAIVRDPEDRPYCEECRVNGPNDPRAVLPYKGNGNCPMGSCVDAIGPHPAHPNGPDPAGSPYAEPVEGDDSDPVEAALQRIRERIWDVMLGAGTGLKGDLLEEFESAIVARERRVAEERIAEAERTSARTFDGYKAALDRALVAEGLAQALKEAIQETHEREHASGDYRDCFHSSCIRVATLSRPTQEAHQ